MCIKKAKIQNIDNIKCSEQLEFLFITAANAKWKWATKHRPLHVLEKRRQEDYEFKVFFG